MLGLFGALISLICVCEISIFERKDLASVKWSPTMIVLFAGYVTSTFLYYALVPFILEVSNCTYILSETFSFHHIQRFSSVHTFFGLVEPIPPTLGNLSYTGKLTVYHCPFCNLCRVGKGLGVDFFHCMECSCCLGMKLVEPECRGKGLESNCTICRAFLFASSEAVRALPCGYFKHSACFQAYTCSHYTSPICSKSLGDVAVYFGMLDALLASEDIPEEYIDRCQDILCNDCDKKKGTSQRNTTDAIPVACIIRG